MGRPQNFSGETEEAWEAPSLSSLYLHALRPHVGIAVGEKARSHP